MIDPDQEVACSLTAAEWNVVLAALQELPFRVSAPLISKLRQQIAIAAPAAFEQPQLNGAEAHGRE